MFRWLYYVSFLVIALLIRSLALAASTVKPTPSNIVRVASRGISVPVHNGTDIRFTHLSTEQGLSQSTVAGIVQDDRGFMWFATQDGLNRFDGYTFKVYHHDQNNSNSLSEEFITAVFKDRAGMLWIGVNRFLDKFDPNKETFTHYTINENSPRAISGSVVSICQDREGMLWLATTNGLDRLEPNTGSFIHYRNDPNNGASLASNDVRAVFQDRGGWIWVATAAGLDALIPGAQSFVHYFYFQNIAPARGGGGNLGIYEDRYGTLWLSSVIGSGLAAFDRKTGTITRYNFEGDQGQGSRVTGINAVCEGRDGTLWLGTIGGGLIKFDRPSNRFIRYKNDAENPDTLGSNFVLSIYQDREGNIWLGTGGGGVDRFPGRPMPFISYKHEPHANSLDQSFVLSAYKDSQGILWIGADRVLTRLDTKTGHFTFFRHRPGANSISSGSVTSAVEDGSGTLWFGTYDGGLNSYNRRTGQFRAYRHEPGDSHSISSDSISKLLVDPSGAMWVATSNGLDRFDTRTEQFRFYPLNPADPPSIRAMAEDQSGALWLGTFDRGLYRFEPRTGTVAHIALTGLSSGRVNSLLADRSGSLWVGTQSGLEQLNPSTRTVAGSYSEREGLANNAVQGILEDSHGDLWIATTNGLSRFDPHNRDFTNYYESDGLAGDEFNYWGVAFKAQDGEMFFGGVKGLTAFYPERVRGNQFVPPIVLTDFRLFNTPVPIGPKSLLTKSISVTNALTLTHSQSIFSFEFSALSFADPKRNRYRYKLEPLETNWNDTGANRRFATYTTIGPGQYVFHVQGSNNRGEWNQEGVNLYIRVLAPWWRRWWALLLEGAFLAVVLCGLYYLRMRTVRRRSRVLRYYADILNSNEDAIIASSFSGAITSWNRSAERLYGYSADEAIGQNIAMLAPEYLKTEGMAILSRIASGESVIRYETVRVRRDGIAIWVSVTASPIHDEKGKLIGMSVIVTDITDRKRAEDEIKALSERVINAQEEERARIARELHDDLNQRIAAVAISLCAISNESTSSNSDTHTRIQRVRNELNQLSTTVRQLSHELHPAVLDYCDIAVALREFCQEFTSLTGVEARFSQAGTFSDVPPAAALCLYRVTQEAMQNVWKHAKTPYAHVLLIRQDNSVKLTISDDGVGFSRDRHHGRQSLGLVSIKERVRLLKGSFDVESAPGRGTTVRIEIYLKSE